MGALSTQAFFDDAAKVAVRQAIQKVESQTSAELVVTVRRQAGTSYQEADFGFGALIAVVSLAVILFTDREFALTWIPVDVAVAFAAGALLCRNVQSLRRLLTLGSRREDETHRAACTAFQELGISRCSGRNGILVLVGLFEHKVAIVGDIAVDPFLIASACEQIKASVDRPVPDFQAFVAALESLGPILGAAMPRQADDVNELPDEMGYA